jgi:glycosyltransferase involved in cell wall biosynthesis
MPMVSVIMITYNHEEFILEAINGILKQNVNFDIEFIIADDNSSYNTKIIVESFSDHPNFSWIKYIKHTTNKGMTSNFSWALLESKGKYIALCEGDDYWTDPNKLQKQVDFLEGNEEYSHCWTRFQKLNQNTKEISIDSNSKYFTLNDIGVDFTVEEFTSGWELGIQTLVFRNSHFPKKALNKYKYFRDVHLITELLSKGKGFCLNSFDAVYRKHEGGIHSGITQIKMNYNAYLIYRELFVAHPENHYLIKQLKYYLNETILVKIKEGKWFDSLKLIMDYYKFVKDFNVLKHHIKLLFLRKIK